MRVCCFVFEAPVIRQTRSENQDIMPSSANLKQRSPRIWVGKCVHSEVSKVEFVWREEPGARACDRGYLIWGREAAATCQSDGPSWDISSSKRQRRPEKQNIRCDGLIHHIRLWSSWAYLERGLKRLNTQLQEAHLRSRSRSDILIPTCDFEVLKVDGGGEGQRNRTSFVSTETLETDAPHAILLLLFWDIHGWAYL